MLFPLILASASPRRAELLRAAGLEFEVIPANADESRHPGEVPDVYVRRLAEAKASLVLSSSAARWVLAADTAVIVDDDILGKPADEDDARRMLRLLSGRTHQVMTGVTLAVPAAIPAAAARFDTRVAVTSVEFASLTPFDIEWYVASGEPMDKAGAYAIQGLASRFIPSIAGSYSNVVGLPIALVCEMLQGA